MAIVKIENLCFTYPGGTEEALKNISLELEEGGFYVICGRSGCGKSTLLRQMKPMLVPGGRRRGTVWYRGKLLQELSPREQSKEIGFVFQNPDNQIVTDKVWHELAFGLESLGVDSASIHLSVAEVATYFGIQSWFHRSVEELSGGQKQLLNLASIMVMHPRVLLLDEPAAQLAPVAALELWQALERIHRELGITVVLAEHQLEEVAGYADKIFVMEKGRIVADGTAAEIGQSLYWKSPDSYAAVSSALPAAMQIYAAACGRGECPCSVAEGRRWLRERVEQAMSQGQMMQHSTVAFSQRYKKTVLKSALKGNGRPVLTLRNVWFRYRGDTPDVLKGLSLEVKEGEIFALMGDNAAGKSTAIKVMAGIYQAQRGNISIAGKRLERYDRQTLYHGLLGVLPQEPASFFVKKTVREDLEAAAADIRKEKRDSAGKGETEAPGYAVTGGVQQVMGLLELDSLSDRHPFDLSGGEQQRAALAKVLLLQPRILLLDEPTKGLDAGFKQKLGGILKELSEQGITIFLVSHDIEFCARFADRAGLFFDGNLTAVKETREFFAGNQYYTTAANRIAREYFPEAILPEEVAAEIQEMENGERNVGALAMDDAFEERLAAGTIESEAGGEVQEAKDRKKGVGILSMCDASGGKSVVAPREVEGELREAENREKDVGILSMCDASGERAAAVSGKSEAGGRLQEVQRWERDVGVLVMGGASGERKAAVPIGGEVEGGVYAPQKGAQTVQILENGTENMAQTGQEAENRLLSGRFLIGYVLGLALFLPLIIWAGKIYFVDRQYLLLGFAIALYGVLPFFFMSGSGKLSVRHLVVLSVMTAIAVAGRAAFFMVPSVKPMAAVVIVTAAAFGAESGFLAGCLTMLLSNMFFGQGPWTPWQMLAMGILGLAAGLIFYRKDTWQRDRLQKRRWLCFYGLFAPIIIYGGIMNPASLLMGSMEITPMSLLGIYLSGLPLDLVHGVTTAVLLAAAGRPILDKLERVKIKYGFEN